MLTTIRGSKDGTTKATPAGETDSPPIEVARTFALAGETNRHEWFCRAAYSLLGDKDPGLQLHYLIGYPVSSCRAYVASDPFKRRRPPEHLVRSVCHTDQGFFSAFMDGCTAPWWLDIEAARALCAQFQIIKRE